MSVPHTLGALITLADQMTVPRSKMYRNPGGAVAAPGERSMGTMGTGRALTVVMDGGGLVGGDFAARTLLSLRDDERAQPAGDLDLEDQRRVPQVPHALEPVSLHGERHLPLQRRRDLL